MNISTWERILEALEDVGDVALAKEALATLDAAGGDPEQDGLFSWEKVRVELEQ